jgi:tetratricopeptide (TPR) repeat protein
MTLRLLLSALALTAAMSGPLAAATCDDPDPSIDLEARVADCEEILGGVFDRSSVPHLVFNLGRALRLLGRNVEALDPLQEALSYNPNSALYWAELARLYLVMREPGTSVAMFSQALQEAPGNIWLIGDRAEAWLDLGRPEDCLADLAASIPDMTGERDQAWYYNLQGRCHAALGAQDEALASYDAATAIVPDYADANGNRLYALSALGRYDEVITRTGTMIGNGPMPESWDLAVRSLRLDALIFRGRGAEVPAELAAMKAQHADNAPEVANLLAWYLFLIGDLQQADTAAAPLRALYEAEDPMVSAYMMATLAQIDLALGNTDLALEEFYTAAWLQPSLATGWIAPLVALGHLPQTRSADSILLTLKNCIKAKGAACDVRPLPAGNSSGALAAAGPADVPGPVPAPVPAQPAGSPDDGTPVFEPAPGDDGGTPAEPVPAAPAPAPPALGAEPAPVRPDQPAEPAAATP